MDAEKPGGVYLNDWKGQTAEDVFREFDADRRSNYREGENRTPASENSKFAGAEILLASYSQLAYEGDAFVLFRRDGKLWEVNGSHCSCYGLEGQWQPEETTIKTLKFRLKHGALGVDGCYGNLFAHELTLVLARLEQEKGEV